MLQRLLRVAGPFRMFDELRDLFFSGVAYHMQVERNAEKCCPRTGKIILVGDIELRSCVHLRVLQIHPMKWRKLRQLSK